MSDGSKSKSGGGGQQPTTAQVGNTTAQQRARYKTAIEISDQYNNLSRSINRQLANLQVKAVKIKEQDRIDRMNILLRRREKLEKAFDSIKNKVNATGKTLLTEYGLTHGNAKVRTNGSYTPSKSQTENGEKEYLLSIGKTKGAKRLNRKRRERK